MCYHWMYDMHGQYVIKGLYGSHRVSIGVSSTFQDFIAFGFAYLTNKETRYNI